MGFIQLLYGMRVLVGGMAGLYLTIAVCVVFTIIILGLLNSISAVEKVLSEVAWYVKYPIAFIAVSFLLGLLLGGTVHDMAMMKVMNRNNPQQQFAAPPSQYFNQMNQYQPTSWPPGSAPNGMPPGMYGMYPPAYQSMPAPQQMLAPQPMPMPQPMPAAQQQVQQQPMQAQQQQQ